jgi:hypothetical protein
LLQVHFNNQMNTSVGGAVWQRHLTGDFHAACEVVKVTASPERASVDTEITYTAETSPSGAPVHWEGDLGDNPVMRGKTLRTRYSSPGKKEVTATCGAEGASTTVAAAADTNKAKVNIVRVRFEAEGGGAAPSPLRVGAGPHKEDRTAKLRVHVEPAEEAENIELSPNPRQNPIVIVHKEDRSAPGIILITVMGTRASDAAHPDGDAIIQAKDRRKELKNLPTQKCVAIVPTWVAPQQQLAYRWRNVCVNADSSPAFPGVGPSDAVLGTHYGWDVRVTVLDQFHDPCGDLFGPDQSQGRDGATVMERFQRKDPAGNRIFRNGNPVFSSAQLTNLELGSDSTYLDPVGYLRWSAQEPMPSQPPTVPINSQQASNHVGSANPVFPLPPIPPGPNRPTNVDLLVVVVDGFELQPLVRREITQQSATTLTLRLQP